MTFVAILSVFAGMLLGIRFKVVAIMPAIIAAMLAAAMVTAAKGNPLMTVLAAAALSAIGVQVGYLCGSFVPFVKEVPEAAPAVRLIRRSTFTRSPPAERPSPATRLSNGPSVLSGTSQIADRKSTAPDNACCPAWDACGKGCAGAGRCRYSCPSFPLVLPTPCRRDRLA